MNPNKFNITPTILEEFRAYHEKEENGAWGLFHVLLSDKNLHVRNVPKPEMCRTPEELYLAAYLRNMSTTQRGRIAKEC